MGRSDCIRQLGQVTRKDPKETKKKINPLYIPVVPYSHAPQLQIISVKSLHTKNALSCTGNLYHSMLLKWHPFTNLSYILPFVTCSCTGKCLTSYPGLPPRLYLAAVEKSMVVRQVWVEGLGMRLGSAYICVLLLACVLSKLRYCR